MRSLWPSWQADWIVFEDADLLVVDKPPTVPCHTTGHGDDLVARLKAWLRQRDGAEPYLGQVHALDVAASGLVVLSRQKDHNRSLAEQFSRGIARSYLLGVNSLGRMADERRRPRRGTAPASSVQHKDSALGHDVLERRGKRMLVEVHSQARSQPIRRIMASMAAPIAGDRDNAGPPASRLLLHARTMELLHPRTGERLQLSTETPARFTRWLQGPDALLPADHTVLLQQLQEAIAHRFSLSRDEHSNICRLVNGAGDDLPGLTLDRYGSYLVLALSDDAAKAQQEVIMRAVDALESDGVYLKRRPKQANVIVDSRREDIAPKQAVLGKDAPEPLLVKEHGLSFEARLGDGLSTGIFLDHRPGRARVRELSKDARVLNLFAYHGAFTVAAIAGGAERTTSIDVSQHALDQAARNLAPYGAPTERHQLVQAEAHTWLEQCANDPKGARFNLIILDPPSFSTTKHAKFQAKRDYQKIASLCLRCLSPQGYLLASCNHRGITHREFTHKLRAAARKVNRTISALKALPAAIDFPASPGEEPHLKAYLLQISER